MVSYKLDILWCSGVGRINLGRFVYWRKEKKHSNIFAHNLYNLWSNFELDLLCGFSSFDGPGAGLSSSGFIFGSLGFCWLCWDPGFGCDVRFTLWIAGFTFWSARRVDFEGAAPWDIGFCGPTGLWMRWGPFDRPRTRWGWIGATKAFGVVCDFCETGIRFGPSPSDCS